MKILIAIPRDRAVEWETSKSIYDLIIPDGVETTLQAFHGYNITQLRNLISDVWAPNFDYVFFVDSDIVLPEDTLVKLLNAQKDIIGGWYIQRNNNNIAEVYRTYGNGVAHIDYKELLAPRIVDVAALGFGGILIKSSVFAAMEMPFFEYFMNNDNTIAESEDANFCRKARAKGFQIWCDTSIIYPHIGARTFLPPIDTGMMTAEPIVLPAKPLGSIEKRLKELSEQPLLPRPHIDYLKKMRKTVKPKVIYDIGACVLHWQKQAQKVWPKSQIIVFEAMPEVEFLYKEADLTYFCGLPLSDVDEKVVKFYKNVGDPGGNSYYKENSPNVEQYFPESSAVEVPTRSLDSIILQAKFPLPDLIKMDVQGAELDILKGATKALTYCQDLILELQTEDYNTGAPKAPEVIGWLKDNGFELVEKFVDSGPDGDYHFRRIT